MIMFSTARLALLLSLSNERSNGAIFMNCGRAPTILISRILAVEFGNGIHHVLLLYGGQLGVNWNGDDFSRRATGFWKVFGAVAEIDETFLHM
jgi:hypothetical protein